MKRLIGLGLVGVSHTIIPSIPNINVILVQKVVLLETISKHIFNHRKQTIIFVFLLSSCVQSYLIFLTYQDQVCDSNFSPTNYNRIFFSTTECKLD